MMRSPCKRAHGYSLIEVLVALVIISIGVLGIAAIQATSLAGTHTSQTESIAAVQARSLADAMLANPGYWNNSSLVPTTAITLAPASGSSSGGVSIGGVTTLGTATTCGLPTSSGCGNATDMAAFDLQTWGSEFFSLVPNATGASIQCNATQPVICTITLTWQEKASTAINAGTQSNTNGTTVTYTLLNEF
ncbi:type IV pilus modification protein PilV [Dyella monticola]|uniref:Type IV pilus modification protein PilV n=1 Tax=Dyella monticola TaxID=1927958 RepID=A0A370X8N1_9GAMM|nr:type IV pilus modification protein PilV [Dyella monticola]RDS84748.1 type IV pilus modification protein PilV [Dyella monticola]